MPLKHSPVPATNRWPVDLAPTPTQATLLSRRFAPPQTLIRRARPIRKWQNGALVGRRLHNAQLVAKPVPGVHMGRSGMIFGRRIPAHLVKGRRWKTLGLVTPIKQYGAKDEGGRNMVDRLRSRKPARNKGLANTRQDSSRRMEGRQGLRQVQPASLPVRLEVDGKVTGLQKMPAQYAYYGPGEQHGAYLLHRAGKIVRVTYIADQRGFRPKFRSFSSNAELDAFLEQHTVPSALHSGDTSLHTIGGIPTIVPVQNNLLNGAIPAADGGTSLLTTPISDHTAAPTLHTLSPITPAGKATSPPRASSSATTTTAPQEERTTTTRPAEDSAAITKPQDDAIATLTSSEDDMSTTLPKEPSSVTTLTPGLDITATVASPGDDDSTITTASSEDITTTTSPKNTTSITESTEDIAINLQLNEQDLTSFQDFTTTSQTEAITSSEDITIMTTSPRDFAVTAITEIPTTVASPGSVLAISEGSEGNTVISLVIDATPDTTSVSSFLPDFTSFPSGDITDKNIQTTTNGITIFNASETLNDITPAPQEDTLDDITLTTKMTTPDAAFTDSLNDITYLTSSEETTTVLYTPTPTRSTTIYLVNNSTEHDTTTTTTLPDRTTSATTVPDDMTTATSTFDDNITVTADDPSTTTPSTNANTTHTSNKTNAATITMSGAVITSSSIEITTLRDITITTLSENIDTFSLTDTTTDISDIPVTNPVTEVTIMSTDATTTQTDGTIETGNDVSPLPSPLTPNITSTSEEDEEVLTTPSAVSF
ncbi:mucin-2-like isoform X2 [Scylla paramamosain]